MTFCECVEWNIPFLGHHLHFIGEPTRYNKGHPPRKADFSLNEIALYSTNF